MTAHPLPAGAIRMMRIGGLLYLAIIGFGLFAEFAVRMPLAGAGPAEIGAAAAMLRLGLTADALMLAADVMLAVLLYGLFRAVDPVLALAAMAFRLIQAAMIGAGLMLMAGAVIAPIEGPWLMRTQALGYDLGLIFFGINGGLMAWLLAGSGWAPRWLAPLLGLAGLVYLAGSFSALLAARLNAALQPAYGLVLLAELAFALWLLRARPRSALPPQPG